MKIIPLLLALALPAAAQLLPAGDPADLGFDADRLTRIDRTLQQRVDAGDLPGAVAAVARYGQVVHLKAYGHADIKKGIPMQPDALFQIWSMTKPVIAVAALILYEEGLFQLDDPVSQYLPAFKNVQVYVDSTAAGLRTEPPHRAMTVRDLFTHTAGLTYGWIGDTPVHHLYKQKLGALPAGTLADEVEALSTLPLLYHPGEGREYSEATNVLARLCEVLSGQELDVFLHQRLFGPLNMEDTDFFVPPAKLGRATTLYRLTPKGLEPQGQPRTQRPTRLSAGGLVSTVADYLRFAQMLLEGGQLDGVRILGRKTVELMTTNQLPPALVPYATDPNAQGYGWGLGLAVLVDPGQAHTPGSVGDFRWDGGANTFFWVDPREELVALLFIQRPPWDYRLYRQYRTLVYQAIAD